MVKTWDITNGKFNADLYIYMAILRDDHQQITRFLALAHIWIHVVEDCVSLRYTSSEQKVKI